MANSAHMHRSKLRSIRSRYLPAPKFWVSRFRPLFWCRQIPWSN